MERTNAHEGENWCAVGNEYGNSVSVLPLIPLILNGFTDFERAGIVAFVKCAKINNLSSADLCEWHQKIMMKMRKLTPTDDTAQLLVWDSAEVSVTIVAASIPALRLLIREVNNSARQYYASSGARNTNQSGSQPGTLRRVTFIKPAGSTDAQSDKSILNSPDAIYYHTEITVEHTSKSVEESFELSERSI